MGWLFAIIVVPLLFIIFAVYAVVKMTVLLLRVALAQVTLRRR